MSDYTKITNFTAKDALTTGDPAKKIVGATFDTEFDAIATAVATKYDSTDLASQGQAEAGTANTVLMTPLRVAEAIAALGSGGDAYTASAVAITGGTINGATVGATTPAAITGTTVSATTLRIGGVEVTSTAAELNTLDGVTATASELNYNDITTLGTAQSSKVVTASAGSAINFNSMALTNVDINSGSVDGATVGAASHSTGKFTTLQATGALTCGAEIVETVYALSGTTPALDPANGTIQTWTLSGNSTPTDSLAAGESITLMVNDGTAYTITWPTMTWIGGSAPTLDTSSYTVIELWKVSTTLYGALVGIAG